MVRVNTVWRATWRSHEIAVYNWWNLFFRTGEALALDGQTLVAQEGWALRYTACLEKEVVVDGEPVTLRAVLGPIDGGLRIGCRIYVNDQQIGGEAAARFLPGWNRELPEKRGQG